MTTPWIDLDGFKLRSVMPAEDVDLLEAQYAGFVAQQLAGFQSRIEGRLRKRYAIPFAEPAPETAVGWLVALTTVACYQRRGWNPSSAENQLIIDAAKQAVEEIKEAADSNEGLFDLPLREDEPETTGISAGGPYSYSEQSPYVGMTLQAITGRSEDSDG